jgi:hypothetical protein
VAPTEKVAKQRGDIHLARGAARIQKSEKHSNMRGVSGKDNSDKTDKFLKLLLFNVIPRSPRGREDREPARRRPSLRANALDPAGRKWAINRELFPA